MGVNALVDVAIGLVFLYLTLSITCTVVNEMLATFFAWRASTLQAGVQQILDDPQLRALFYDHGAVDSARQVSNPKQDDKPHPPYISGEAFAMGLLGALDRTKPLPQFADIQAAVLQLPNSNIRDVLLAHISAAGQNLDTLRAGLANWFDHAMDRLGDEYKRRLRFYSFVVGLGLACILNVDTVAVVRTLWSDGSVRQQMADLGSRAVAAKAGAPAFAAPATSAASSPIDARQMAQAIKDLDEGLRPLPLGWTLQWPDGGAAALFGATISKLLGLLLTALALSLGAPFWFDVLSKFMQVRGTGEKPSRSDPAT